MRLFTAINFSEDTRAKLLSIQNELKSMAERGNFTVPENIHLTLIFLGESDERQAALVMGAMDSLRFKAFDIEIYKTGRFQRGGGDLWWAGVRENGALARVYSELHEKFTAIGCKPDSKSYKPHITLGREVVMRRPAAGGETDGGNGRSSGGRSGVGSGRAGGGWAEGGGRAAGGDFKPFGETIEAVDLMKSEHIRGKLIYTKIHSVKALEV